MRGKAIYFYALKEDMIERIKEVEEKFGGLQYVVYKTYKEPKLIIYNNIEEIEDFGIIKSHRISYYIALKNQKIDIETVELLEGGYSYYPLDEKGILKFNPSGIYEGTNCILIGELSTVSENETRQLIFKELKKSMLKNMMLIAKGGVSYVGKSIVQNSEKYRLPYGGVNSDPKYDRDVSKLIWRKK